MRRRLLVSGSLLLVAACSPASPPSWQRASELPRACQDSRSEADFEALAGAMKGWLDGDLQLFALPPSAIEELTGAPISRSPASLVWSYRFTPVAEGHESAPLIDVDGYPRSVEPASHDHDEQAYFIDLRVVTAEHAYARPSVFFGDAPPGLLARSFHPHQLDYLGPLFSGDTALHGHSAETRERGFGLLAPLPREADDGDERVEIVARVALPWSGSNSRRGACTATARASVALPPGPTLWDRFNRAFLDRPLRVRGGAIQAPGEPTPVAPPAAVATDAACASGQSEGCYQAAVELLRPSLPATTPAPGGAASVRVSPGQLASARALLGRGCDLGHGPACGALGRLLGVATPPDRAGALAASERACQLDFGDGCTSVGAAALARGDTSAALAWFGTGCRLGSATGCYADAQHTAHSRGPAEALARYQQSCVYGEALGCARYALEAERDPRTERLAREGYLLACSANVGWACNALALLESRDPRPSPALIEQALARACSLGDPGGCDNQRALAARRALRPLARPPASDQLLP